MPVGGDAAELPSGLLPRRVLCAMLAHDCPPPDEPCVPLAIVQLGDTSGIEACATRTNIYSNETLLDLILCLAEQIAARVQIEDAGGDAQTGKAGEVLDNPVAVRVVSGGAPLAGAKVRFRVRGGGGQVSEVPEGDAQPSEADEITIAADDSGIASAEWRLGDAAGLNTVEASVEGESARMTFHALAKEDQG